MDTIEQCFFQMYKMDWDFHFVDKAYMQNLVVQGYLSAENYQKIVGEPYTAPAGK